MKKAQLGNRIWETTVSRSSAVKIYKSAFWRGLRSMVCQLVGFPQWRCTRRKGRETEEWFSHLCSSWT